MGFLPRDYFGASVSNRLSNSTLEFGSRSRSQVRKDSGLLFEELSDPEIESVGGALVPGGLCATGS